MNFLRVTPPLVISFLFFAAFATAGCSDKNKASEVKINISSDAQSAGDTMSAVATNVKETASDTWARIKDDTFDQRADFQSGYQQLISDSDSAIQRLDAKRATLSDMDAKDWDSAMKELKDARADLDDKLGQLKSAASDTWSDAKDKATNAWQRVVDDLDKVKTTTTP